MATTVELHRSFSRPNKKSENDEDWTHYIDFGERGRLTWSDLYEQRVVVVVGEAGIGKTTEFKSETVRLSRAGKPAFFIELSQLVDSDSWSLALGPANAAFEAWRQSTEEGYFFLDAVDESRLKSHAALKKALQVVYANLHQHFPRVHVAVSSRWTDWSIQDVQAVVGELLVSPIALASAPKPKSHVDPINGAATVLVQEPPTDKSAETFVVSLAPLSLVEAQKLAVAWLVPDAEGFWTAVRDGEYEHLATRPLDLGWMVELWKAKRTLGTYRELLEGSITNRLTDTNPSYQASGAVLALQQLRDGAELLAAATELSGQAYISCELTSVPCHELVAPHSALSGWAANEITRLLASALFDEATFGRVKFHHRTARAYLAACWLDRQLQLGVPLHRIVSAFVASPFGEPVLIPSRRWALCWLAAINAKVREWLVRRFPEMLLLDGDPEAWDQLSADAAFARYVQRLCEGFRPDWYNNAAEFKRVGNALSPGLIARYLSDAALPTNVKVSLFSIVVHARLLDCASAVFDFYANSPSGSREQLRALQSMRTLATSEQREAIKVALLSCSLQSNELIAAALSIVWESVTAAELTHIFMMTGSESEYGQGPIARAITEDLLPAATLQAASAIQEAVTACLSKLDANQRFNKFHGPKPQRAWLLDVLPMCLERVLSLTSTTTSAYPVGCLEAAACIELFRDDWYTNHDLQSIHDEIARHSNLRWQLARAFFALNLSQLTARICWSGCLVTFGIEDLHGLTVRANDGHLPADERQFWFEVADTVAMGSLRKEARRKAQKALTTGVDGEVRAKLIAAGRARTARGMVHQRQWAREQRKSESERLAQLQRTIEDVRRNIEHLRDASHIGTLCWLVQYSFSHSGRDDMFQVDYATIELDLGSDLAEALATGLKQLWLSTEPPDPSKYANGAVPWAAILAVAGLYTEIGEGQDTARFSEVDAARAARLAVWELNRPPAWFDALVASNAAVVEEALHPWIVAEAFQDGGPGHTRRTLDLALHCESSTRAGLLRPLVQPVLNLEIPTPATFNELVDALRQDGLLADEALEQLCCAQLAKVRGRDELLGDTHWLRVWLQVNPHHAFDWFEKGLCCVAETARAQVEQLVSAISDFKWLRQPIDDSSVGLLMRVHVLVSMHRSKAVITSDQANTDMFAPTMTRVLETIPGILVGIPGCTAHRALVELASKEVDSVTKAWLIGRVNQHASSEAALSATFDIRGLQSIASPLCREPQNEGELFEQVVARLEELRTGVEEGPFSDRDLFSKGMKEKVLQLWLAARLRDTPHRRFSVHREENVDADKATDIQVSARNWNVCIEIKPVDADRSYSAASLTGTLREQLVDQYLKGFNSSHGILVLFRLDGKTWEIPGVGKTTTILCSGAVSERPG
ncbi:hypothetical protein ACQ4P5_13860 [Ralstonia sp. L16]|uniref:hypothetical protein n=1 Tax=Ralstonia sp. L16 TaxID=3423950 RepID=UPI003F7B2769